MSVGRNPDFAIYYSPGDGGELLPEVQRVRRQAPETLIAIVAESYEHNQAEALGRVADMVLDRKRLDDRTLGSLLLGHMRQIARCRKKDAAAAASAIVAPAPRAPTVH